jgi:hypothetical protein
VWSLSAIERLGPKEVYLLFIKNEENEAWALDPKGER